MIRKVLLFLTAVAIFNESAANLYLFLVWHDTPVVSLFVMDLVGLFLGFMLVKRHNLLGVCILILFTGRGLNTSYQIDGRFFSMGLLKYGPQVIFTNGLYMLIILFALIYFFMQLQRKRRKNRADHVSH